jgi:hypothetical protein
MSEDTITTITSETTTSVKPIVINKVTRLIYVGHKVYGTCITLAAQVYVAPAGLPYDKKIVYREDFTVADGVVKDMCGREWLCVGENGGCGPRLPAHLKAQYGAAWHSMSFLARAELLKSLAPAK